MAIHPSIRSERERERAHEHRSLTQQQALDISAWTEQAAASLQILDISDSVAEIGATTTATATPTTVTATTATPIRGTSNELSIPLDGPIVKSPSPRVKIVGQSSDEDISTAPSNTYRRREPIRRDSLKRREALLKGKEGSRRRQRWENDRLLNNPWAQPPAPGDWIPQPTHPRHDPVPYYLAPLWDSHFAHKEHEKTRKQQHAKRSSGVDDEKSRVSREVRKSLKHARAARGMLQDLEEDIRQFLEMWNDKQLELDFGDGDSNSGSCSSDFDDSDEEIVFVGRNGQMHDSSSARKKEKSDESIRDGQKMVFESLAHDPGAVFGRWLVHSIATYYGLYTWSVTAGSPARRQAYVGLNPPAATSHVSDVAFPSGQGQLRAAYGTATRVKPGEPLPKPLWVQV